MKIILKLLGPAAVLAASPLATADTLPSEKRKNGPLIRQALAPVQASLQESSAAFYNNETSRAFLYGTVVSSDGLILTKASELAEVTDFHVRVGTKKYRNPQVVGQDETWDVALVQIEAEELKPVDVPKSPTFAHGTWVVSNGATERRFRRPRPGIISANKREIPRWGGVMLGVGLEEVDGVLLIQAITGESGADEAGLEKNDEMISIDGKEVSKRDEVLAALKDKKPGDTLAVVVKRSDEELAFEVELKSRADLSERKMTRNDQLSGGQDQQSERRSGFPVVIQHETMLTRYEVGGPVFTLDNEFVGMNIAAVNRVEAFAIPGEEIPGILARLKSSGNESSSVD